MRKIIIMLLLLGIIVSGCIDNPLKQVPVVKVNVTFVEKEGQFYPEHITIIQGTVDYAARPMKTNVQSFPAISARVLVVKNNNATMQALGQWENLPFTGNGTYNFNIGFNEKNYPNPGDLLGISIIVSDKNGRRIGYVTENQVWGSI
jgi:hypothetical protein